MSRPSVATLDDLLDEIIGNARIGDWDRNSAIAPAMSAALAGLAADLDASPPTAQELPVLKALHAKIEQASQMSEERLTQIRPLIEAFAETRAATGDR